MPRRRETNWERDQKLFGNSNPSETRFAQRMDEALERRFEQGVARMEGILAGKNEGAAIAAFKAVAELYEARQRLQTGRILSKQKMSKGEKIAELVDIMRSLTPEDRAQVVDLAEMEEDLTPKSAADAVVLTDVAKIENL